MITVQRKGKQIAIIADRDDWESLRIACQPCQCGHVKSNRTNVVRSFFVKVIGFGLSLKTDQAQHVNTEELEQTKELEGK